LGWENKFPVFEGGRRRINLKRKPVKRHQKLCRTAGFNNPVGWARTGAASPLEPADAFNIPVPERN
jgi:hypothetical protein